MLIALGVYFSFQVVLVGWFWINYLRWRGPSPHEVDAELGIVTAVQLDCLRGQRLVLERVAHVRARGDLQ